MKIKDVANSAWTGVTNLASKTGKIPKKYLLPAVLVTGMTVGGGSVALAQNNKDSFKKTELLAQNSSKKSTNKEFEVTAFNNWIAYVVKNQKTIPLSKMEPFSYEGNKESKMGVLTSLKYMDWEFNNVSNPKLSPVEYASEIMNVFKIMGHSQAGTAELQDVVLNNQQFIAEFNAYDVDKSGTIEDYELATKYRFLDELDGVRDKKISAESYLKTDYTKPEIRPLLMKAARAVYKDIKEGTE